MICKECDNETFDEEDDGFIYCKQCGVRVDDIIQTGVDDGDLIGEGGGTQGAMYDPRNRRIQSQKITPLQLHVTSDTMRYSQFRSQLESESQMIPKSGIEKMGLFREVKREPENELTELTEPEDFGAETLSYKDYYEETRDRYVKGFVMMVTYQCDALVEKFNVTPLIIGLVGPVCLRFVALSGVYDDDWADNAMHDSEAQLEEEELKDDKKKKPRTHKAEPRNIAGAPILPNDIVRWAREGKIPYLTCFLKIQEQMGKRSAACPVEASKMFRPFQIVSAQMLEAQAASIADIIGLPLPPVNFYGIASNYLKRLSIPEDKTLDLVRLIHTWSMPPDLYLSKNELRLPTRVCVMSILIVAIRMIYNINGSGVWERSFGLDKASSEADMVCEEFDSPVHDEEVSETKSGAAESLDVTKATEFDTEELLKNLEAKYHEITEETLESEKDLLSYISLGKNEMFAGLEEDAPDDTYRTVSNLWDGYPKEEEEFERFTTPLKRGREWEDDISLNQLSLEDSKFSNGNNSCSSPSRRNKSISMDRDQSSSEQEDHHEEEKSKERTINRLITDMGENLFSYIPPRLKVERLDYLQYVRKKEDGAFIYAAHADYYILLRVCALVAEIDGRNMHRGVLSFERRLAWIEKRIDQVLHVTPPIMTCDHCCDGRNVGEDQHD
ncbi:TATA box-binding protein-associated factor RNA polymerase I subunit B [Cardamine amara subsp. amara]|uniref:TATA box-binding protein-associated factor RNA polymerase I subunit B n=1 Tax=Cardamine amara subsp. amara TaxID=228776 RepID=A0ABD1B921_CARAN